MRHALLGKVVRHQYHGFLDLAEALTAVRSKDMHFGDQRENVISLLDTWRRRDEIRELSQTLLSRADRHSSLEEVIGLLHFYKILRFFLEDFSNNAPRTPWIQPAQWESEYLPLQLSLSEKRRFLRATCRLQILKNIFGDPAYLVGAWNTPDDRDKIEWRLRDQGEPWAVDEEAYRLFYGPMALWEHEEMGCVLRYFMTKFNAITEEIADNLRKLSKNTPCKYFWEILPKEQKLPQGCEIGVELDLDNFHQYHKGLGGLGPEFLYRVLHMDPLSRRDTVCMNTRAYWSGPFIGLEIGLSQDIYFPCIDPADRHEAPDFEQFWFTLSPLEQPTVGWKKAWLMPHSREDILEDFLNPDRTETDWEWCYAIWDEKRLNEWKAPLLGGDCSGEAVPIR